MSVNDSESKGSRAVIKPLRVFEAFAGIGAQVKALKRAGISYQSVGISEWFIDAIIAYDALNNADLPVPPLPPFEEQVKYLDKFSFSLNSQDPLKRSVYYLGREKVRKLYIANVRSKNVGSITKVKPSEIPTCDFLTYSFPCQDLSTGGKTLGMKKGSNTRSGLLWEIERILKGLSLENRLPKFLLLENVPTITAPSNIKDLEEWLGVLTSLGYKNSKPIVVDSSHFGVRQDRKRCLIFSVLGRKAVELEGHLKERKLPPISYFYKNDYSNPVYKKEADEASLNDTHSREIMWRINHRDPVTEKTIFHTVTCNMDRNNNAGMVRYDGPNHRWFRLLTCREAFLLMGFSESDFEILSSLGFSYRRNNKLIGNSIVVNVLEAVFEYVFSDFKIRGN